MVKTLKMSRNITVVTASRQNTVRSIVLVPVHMIFSCNSRVHTHETVTLNHAPKFVTIWKMKKK